MIIPQAFDHPAGVSFRFVSFRFVSFRFVSFRSVSFRFVGIDAGRPLVRGTSFWGFRTNVNSMLPRTHWAAWSIRQEGSTPVVIHQVAVVETLAESFRPRVCIVEDKGGTASRDARYFYAFSTRCPPSPMTFDF